MLQAAKWTEFPKYPVIAGTALLAIGISVASWAGWDISRLAENGMIRHGQLWRLVTSIFPHGNLLHLVFNIYWLWIFGTTLERVFGHLRTAALVCLFAVIPNALEYAFSVGGIGLSGVGYGMFGLLWILSRHHDRFHEAMDSRTIQLFVLWFFFCIFMTIANVMQIANIAHGTGAVLGILTGYAITLPERRTTIVAGLGVFLAFSLWSATAGRPRVNLSAYASYDECKLGYDAMQAKRNQEALQWFLAAAGYRHNQPACQTDLGYAYHAVGKPVESLSAYRKAAEMGDFGSQYYLGDLYAKGDGTLAKDTKQASLWYRKAAESDSSDILNNVAWALATSEDPAIQDPAAALAYAQKAVNAEHGNPRAFILDTLAQAYYVNKQYENAFNTERKAIQVAGPEEKEKYNTQMEVYRLAVADQKLPKPRKRT